MKKLFNKSIAMLMALSMLLGTFGTMSGFAQNIDANYAKADFDAVTSAEGTHNGMALEHKPEAGKTKDGAPVIVENPIPYYGAMLKYAQSSPGNLQRMVFTLDEPIAIGVNASENSYAEFSYDIKLENKTTGVTFDFGGGLYILNLNALGQLIGNNTTTHATIASGTNKVFNNIRVRVDLDAKTVVGIYANDELVADLSEEPLAWKETTAETINQFRFWIGKGSVTDTLYLDNVNVVTYTSEDGTSPIANKASLRAELDKFTRVGLSGSAKVTFDNAVALAKNPIASQSDVDAIVAALGNINPSEFPVIVASATFDNCDATTVVGTHNGMKLQHIAGSGGTTAGAPVIVENSVPYYGAMLTYAQSKPASVQRMVFTLDTPIEIGENAPENSYAEFAYDLKLENGTTGVLFDFGGSLYNLNLNGSGALISNNTTTHATIASGTNKVFNNIRVRVDLDAKTVVGIYANDELVADLSQEPLACAEATAESINQFRIYIAKAAVNDTLYLDNVNVVTYTSEDGTSPIANKTALRAELDEFIGADLSESAKVIFDNAVALAKNPAASQSDVDAMVVALENINPSGLPKVVASATFDNCDATTVVGTHNGMQLQHIAGSGGTKAGAPVIDENPIPYYGAMLKYAQSKPASVQRMVFTLDTPIEIGENAPENSYAEFAYDLKLEKGTTGVLFDFGGSLYNLNLNGSGALISNNTTTHATIASGTNKKFNNIRVRVDLNAKTVVGIYANDELVADLSQEPLACAEATAESINQFRIYIAKAATIDTLYLDNVNVVTYTSEDGTSPIANKTALRAKIAEIYEYSFSDSDQTKFNSALEVAINPLASKEDIDYALAALQTIVVSGIKTLAFEDFEGGADGSYDDFTYRTTYNKNAAATETIATATDKNPIFNNMFSVLQGEQAGDSSAVKFMYPIANFTLKNVVDFENAAAGQFAEISFDAKVDAKYSTLACSLYDVNGNDLGQINIGSDLVRVGVGYVDVDNQVGKYSTVGLADGYNKNVKLVLDLYNKQIASVYVDGVQMLDRTEDNNPIGNIDLASDAASNIAEIRFNWGNGSDTKGSAGYTFAIDNLRVMTYKDASPEADKKALYNEICKYYSMADAGILANAVAVYKDIYATEAEITDAVERLQGDLNMYMSQIKVRTDIYTDKLEKPDFSDDGVELAVISEPAGYIDGDLNVTQPIGGSVDVAITYTLSRGDKSVSKTYNVTVHPRVMVEINEAIFEDAEGNVVYGPVDGGKLKSVSLKNNSTNNDLIFYAAAYEGGRLQSAKPAPVTNGTKTLDMAVNKNSEIKYFVWEDGTLMPVQKVREVSPEKPTIHIVAASTYSDYTLDAYKGLQPDYGIGQALSVICAKTDININNKAHPGSKTESWYEEGRLDALLKDVKQGDYVIISLCHNDQKYIDAVEYKANLIRIANDVKEQGGIPILVTAVPRYLWNDDGTLKVTHTTENGNYVQTLIDAGTENNIPVINMNAHLRELFTAEGTTSTTYEYFYSQKEGESLDTTHLSEDGAMYCANWLISEFKEMGFPFVQNLADE